jgi:hypothetical protein
LDSFVDLQALRFGEAARDTIASTFRLSHAVSRVSHRVGPSVYTAGLKPQPGSENSGAQWGKRLVEKGKEFAVLGHARHSLSALVPHLLPKQTPTSPPLSNGRMSDSAAAAGTLSLLSGCNHTL